MLLMFFFVKGGSLGIKDVGEGLLNLKVAPEKKT